MASADHDVIIAGAGPIGLFLACELAMRDISVLVLERDADPSDLWKKAPFGLRGMNTPTAEHFYRRDLLEKLNDRDESGGLKNFAGQAENRGKAVEFRYGGHFAGLALDASKMEKSRWKWLIPGPSMIPRPTTIERIEAVLAERAVSLGVEIVRGCGVQSMTENVVDGVTVEAGPEKRLFKAKWLVGCDGGRSVIRHEAGFDFPGIEPTFTGYMAQCEWDSPEITPGWHYDPERGMHIVRPPNMLYVADFDGGRFDRNQELSEETLSKVLRKVSGVADVNVKNIQISSTFTDRCRQASTYRRGHVLLAGDAAHVHSPLGAQGLNLGIGDAMNLGWKLAATIKSGTPDFTLLDTYEAERHPIGAWVMEWQRTQVSALKPDPWGAATRKIISEIIETVDGANLFIDRFWGLSLKYDLADPHDLVGRSCPDFELEDESRVGEAFKNGKAVMIDFAGSQGLRDLLEADGKGEVEYVTPAVKDTLGLKALFVRPDGVVAWVANERLEEDLEQAKSAWRKWIL